MLMDNFSQWILVGNWVKTDYCLLFPLFNVPRLPLMLIRKSHKT